jgi:hypothetical protein
MQMHCLLEVTTSFDGFVKQINIKIPEINLGFLEWLILFKQAMLLLDVGLALGLA